MHAERSAGSCACQLAGIIVDAARHASWHASIHPLLTADAATLESAYGRPSVPTRTYVDDQFAAART